MGSLADLVGSVFDLHPPLNVEPGTVLLTLKHGAPQGVVRPGRKLRRGKGLPLTLAPQGVAVSTEDVPINVKVSNIALQGDYSLPQLELDIAIAVDGKDDFAGLQSYVARKGLNFAALLDGEVGNELDKVVRDALRGHTAVELYERGNLTDLVATHRLLMEGLFRLESVQRAQPTWHPEFVRARDAAASAAASLAEKLLALQHREGVDRALAQAEDQLALEQALRRNLTLIELENPELIAQASAQEHELKLELVRQMDALRRGGGTDVVRAALEMISGMKAGEGPGESPQAAGPAAALASPQTAPWALDTLERDAALARMWRKAGLPGEPIGLSFYERDDDVTVVFVCGDSLDRDTLEAIDSMYRERVGASEVVALLGITTVEEAVREFLLTRIPELRAADPAIRLQRAGQRVTVHIASERARLSPHVRRFNEPGSSLLSPLTELLDVETIDVEVAEPA